jgi:hypothetical protein
MNTTRSYSDNRNRVSDPVTNNVYLYANANPVRWIDPFGLDASCDIDGALTAEEQRKQAENDKIAALLIGDDVAYAVAVERINYFIQAYLAAMRQGEGNGDLPPPRRVTPTPPKFDPAAQPPPTIKLENL